MRRFFSPGLILACLCCAAGAVTADTIHSVNPASGLSRWTSTGEYYSLELVQVTPDYARAVFSARGLPADVVDAVSSYCILGTIIRNVGAQPFSYRLSDWYLVTEDGKQHRLKPKSQWLQEWRASGVGFRWLLLADSQSFDSGDWIQGFTTVALVPGRRFDLHFSWNRQGKTSRHVIKGMSCAGNQTSN